MTYERFCGKFQLFIARQWPENDSTSFTKRDFRRNSQQRMGQAKYQVFFFFLRKSTFEHKTIKPGHKMVVGVKKSAKHDFQVFRFSKVPSFFRKFTFEHKTTQSGHKMPIWVKKIGRRLDDFKVFRLSYKGVWDCFSQTPTPCMPGGRK